jgi:pimeloyl-ACP methyl ester carboxylesterase
MRSGLPREGQIDGVAPPFEVMASMLGAWGYASFRWDKRAGAYADAYASNRAQSTGIDEEYIEDLGAAVEALRTADLLGGKPLFLVGHSLGAIAALHYARTHPWVTGVATVGAPVQDLGTTLALQLEGKVPEGAYQTLISALELASAGRLTQPILGLPPSYWADYAHHTLQQELLRSRPDMPILVLHGERDQAIPVEQFRSFVARLPRLPNVETVVVPGADHFLMVRAPERKGDDGDYAMDALGEWLGRVSGGSGG